jgi:hypothetical protein
VSTRQLRAAAVAAGAIVGAGVLSVGMLIPPSGVGASLVSKVAVAGAMVPHIPNDVTQLGAVPGGQDVHFDVTLAGQDPSGLAAFVTAVSAPGSPSYRHYLTASQFAATFGPSASEVADVSSALRAEGLTVGVPLAGSALLPVQGSASAVSAALSTPLESVRLPTGGTSFVNTAAPQIPAAVAHDVVGVVGLGGLAREHAMDLHQPGASGSDGGATGSHDLVAHASGPQACGSAAAAAGTQSYTSTQLSNDYGLTQLFSQGRTGIGQTIGIVEFEQYAQSDINAFESCYGLSNPVHTVTVDGPVGGPPNGSSESALDIELAAVNAPSSQIIVYEAPNEESDAASVDLFNRIAGDDAAQVVTTSWGICEALNAPGDATAESGIFSRMAAQGQTMIAASGDAGSEDCFPTERSNTGLSVDDPGVQPDVISAGGTSLVANSIATQSVWNDCQSFFINCDNPANSGAGGGGYSQLWARPAWQPAASGGGTDPCAQPSGCRSVPDLSGPANPSHGVVAYYGGFGGWTVYGGTSAVAPTFAGLFADTDQGCNNPIGMVGPTLYAANNASTVTDVSSGNNDYTGTNGGSFAAHGGYDAATGLGTPQDQNLTIALQGGDGCPSVANLSAHAGPLDNGGAITIFGGGLANASQVTFGPAGPGVILTRSETSLTVLPPSPQTPACVDVTVTNTQGLSAVNVLDRYGFAGATNCAGSGYRFVASDGGIFAFGAAPFLGSTGGQPLNKPIVGMANTPSGDGYWLVASDGGIFTFGDAQYFGSTGAVHLNKPIVGMAATPNGQGYWLVASDGGIFAFGNARFYGSTGATRLNKAIVGMAATPDGHGYWLVASDGGIFTFGDASFYGSTGGIVLNQPIVGMAPTTGGNGYWLVASDGGIFAFGNANFFGSTGAIHLNQPIVGLASSTDSGGYWLVASDGGIFAFGDATFYGSTGSIHLNQPIVGMAPV